MQLKEKITRILRKEYSGKRPWEAFVYWWLSANGYDYEVQPSLVKFVDGPRDGGIDVIAWPLENQTRNDVLVVQSKFFGQSPTSRDIQKFRDAVAAINGSLDEFQTWLDDCRDELHAHYRRLRELRQRNRYILIAPTRVDASLKRSLSGDDIEVHDLDFLGNLERNYTEGRTPRLDEIRIANASPPRRISNTNGTSVWIFTVPARELGLIYERHGDVLFAGNIRYALRGETAQRVRTGMLDTLQNAPHEFVFSHNGITISGNGIRRRGRLVVLRSATIVNGAQTVSYLGKPNVMRYLARNPARVIVKFVEVDDSDLLNDIESKVAFRSNNQNKVDPSDLMIELPSLVSLQRYFRRHGVHLERKKGEQKLHYGQLSISKERLAQVLSAVESSQGAVKGKRKQELFMDSAQRLFSDYDASENSRAEAVTWARVDTIFRWTIYGFANDKRKKRAQLAELASLQVFHKALQSTGLKNGFLRAMARWESESDSLEPFLEKSFKVVMAALLRYSARAKKNEPAFYKALESVKPAVNFATRRSRKKIRDYYRDYLG
jgi:hypothetical protein